MAKFKEQLLVLVLILLPALPAQAQQAALEQPASSIGGDPQVQGSQIQPHPQAASATIDNQSNLRHWSHFSQSSTSNVFVRVAPGAKCQGQANHYIRPKCIEPGSLPATAQSQKGPVKRYLAYNVPPGSCVRKPVTASAAKSSASAAKSPAVVAAVKKTAKKQVMALGYGTKPGEVTYTPATKWSGTAISCYGRYH